MPHFPEITGFFRSVIYTFSSCSTNTGERPPPSADSATTSPKRTSLTLPIHSNAAGNSVISPTLEAFTPSPIDTSHMVLPDCVIGLRDVLAENLHEVWSLNKIQAGWAYALERDDLHKKHPCLTTYQLLSDTEKEYDITLTMETLKALTALGYQFSDQIAAEKRPNVMEVPEEYRQTNGYKPLPFDLSRCHLDADVENLVETLAANLHEIWAKNRIQQGWQYGNSEDNQCKRSPHLVPYDKIDWTIKKANRDAVQNIVKSLIALGCNLHSPKLKSSSRSENSSRTRVMDASKTNSNVSLSESVSQSPKSSVT
ncbi:ryanodine receptor 1-like [Paramacrobiotus metropolitanus]|uniref:ryanodine receptor 1-like n=1 Tax=Paramacrobiotus metropolitanus TaxID=2943436 RepID=UPI0024462CE8|nr:ryanodine receptor 1-like [Paramacrobiotus metropolitanus]